MLAAGAAFTNACHRPSVGAIVNPFTTKSDIAATPFYPVV
jgi:hypothetical protein